LGLHRNGSYPQNGQDDSFNGPELERPTIFKGFHVSPECCKVARLWRFSSPINPEGCAGNFSETSALFSPTRGGGQFGRHSLEH
jgi:hypothetical protein